MVHQQVCDYLKMRYPAVIFRTDFASGLKLPPQVAIRHARHQSGRAFPDLVIYEPSHVLYGDYPLLAIELKAEGIELYKKDGTLRKNEHIEEQAAMLQKLRDKGYKAEFCIGFEPARKLIDEYLTGGSPLF
jgi:hypothetical protein